MSAPAVLLVEDYPANALVGQTYITHCGFQCDVATTREQVLRLATANEYAVIFMDLRLGDDCGLEITKRLREREAARGERRRRIIAMTASAMLGGPPALHRCGHGRLYQQALPPTGHLQQTESGLITQ